MKEVFFTAAGIAGAIIAAIFGTWSNIMTTLLVFMGFDYLTGLIVAGVFHASEKTAGGGLESRAGWKGLCRKGMTLLVVAVAARIDVLLNTTYFRDGVAIAFIINETLSIIENAGLMGVPIPEVLKNAIEVLKTKSTPPSE